MKRMPYCSRLPNRGGPLAGRAHARANPHVMDTTLLARMISVTGRAGPRYLRRADDMLKLSPEHTAHGMPVSHNSLRGESHAKEVLDGKDASRC